MTKHLSCDRWRISGNCLLFLLLCTTTNSFVFHGQHSIRHAMLSSRRDSFLPRTLKKTTILKPNVFSKSFHQGIAMYASDKDINDQDDTTKSISAGSNNIYSILMIAIPFLSLLFPFLLNVARSYPEGSSEQYIVIATLFASNRLYLYVMSTTILVLAAVRGSQDDARLGQRVVSLTEELLYNPSLEEISRRNVDSFESRPAMIQSLSNEIGEGLDTVSTETQAILLPLLISALLASSVFFLQFFDTDKGIASGDTVGLDNIQDLLTQYLPQISKLWNILILSIFARCESRRLVYELKLPLPDIFSWAMGVAITCVAYAGIWPAQNFVNMALAVLVARAIQITRFPAIVAALTLLTFYDAASVFLIKPAYAVDMITTVLTSSSVDIGDTNTASSAMGAVAMNKLSSADFQPGLLVTRVGKSLGGALGLGDAVFPSILGIFVKRYDDSISDSTSNRVSLLTASIVGYVGGCLSCELLPLLSTSGVPALVLINPFMLLAVSVVANIQGEVQDLWNYNPSTEVPDECN